MFSGNPLHGALLVLAALLPVPSPCLGRGLPSAEPFDGQTWSRLAVETRQRAIVVFSATYCVHCPAVIQKLAKEKMKYGKNVVLVAVVMDGTSEIRGKPPYDKVDRLFVFNGHEPAIRYSVNPDWRGVTPYTVLLSPERAPHYIAGPPSEKDLQQFFAKNAAGFR
jgi:thiol-disulfide isomerase/thioredoxin